MAFTLYSSGCPWPSPSAHWCGEAARGGKKGGGGGGGLSTTMPLWHGVECNETRRSQPRRFLGDSASTRPSNSASRLLVSALSSERRASSSALALSMSVGKSWNAAS